jgi:hypothetical protein
LTRKIVTKTDVYVAANFIAASGEIPTITAVRGVLGGRGSETTILNFLRNWKKERLLPNNAPVIVLDDNPLDLAEENRQMRQALKQQVAHNENYAEELINAEKAVANLQSENQQLQSKNQRLQEKLLEVTNLKDLLATLWHELKTTFSNDLDKILNDKNKLIDQLQQEIRDLNKISFKVVQQTSSDGHDLLMQEKVKMLNLEEKVDQLKKQLDKQQNEILTIHKVWKERQQPLSKQLARQKQIIADLIDPETLKNYEETHLLEVIK